MRVLSRRPRRKLSWENEWAGRHGVAAFVIMLSCLAVAGTLGWLAEVGIYGIRGPQRGSDVFACVVMLLLAGLNGLVLGELALMIIDCREKRDGRQ